MKPTLIKELCDGAHGFLKYKGDSDWVTGVSIDTRTVMPGDLFVAIKGEKTDGHQYLKEARAAGATAALCDQDVDKVEGLSVIQVEDSVRALQKWAAVYRGQFQIPVVAVTGSSGKTTTKNILVQILSQKFRTLGTLGNKNNHIGMPLMACLLDDTTQAAVFEMGMSGFGEIETLVEIAKPDIAIITNIGTAHLEMLGSRENILKAKSELFHTLKPHQIAMINGDDELLCTLPKGTFRTYRYGIKGTQLDLTCLSYRATREGLTMIVQEKGESHKEEYSFVLPGEHNVYNCLAGIATGKLLGMSANEIREGLHSFQPMDHRMELIPAGKGLLIDDTYNANPHSMKSALQVLALYKDQGPVVAVLGDMLEMGPEGPMYHEVVGEYAAQLGVDALFTCGKAALHYGIGAKKAGLKQDQMQHYEDQKALERSLIPYLEQKGTVLLKGSRGMKMDQWISEIKELAE